MITKKVLGTVAIAGLVVVAVGAVVWLVFTLFALARSEKIVEANERAMADTTRVYKHASDTLTTTVARFQIQRKIDSDSIRELNTSLGTAFNDGKLDAKALTDLRLDFAALKRRVEVPTVSLGIDTGYIYVDPLTGDTLVLPIYDMLATDTLVGPPIDGTITVLAPAGGLRPMVFEEDLRVTSFTTTYSVACSEAGDAVVAVQLPNYIKGTLERGSVEADICNPRYPGWGVTLGIGGLVSFTGGVGITLAILKAFGVI